MTATVRGGVRKGVNDHFEEGRCALFLFGSCGCTSRGYGSRMLFTAGAEELEGQGCSGIATFKNIHSLVALSCGKAFSFTNYYETT